MPLYEDPLLFAENSGNTGDSTLFAAPSSGIGIAPEQAPSPVASAEIQPVVPPVNRFAQQQDFRKQAIAQMGGGEKFLSALGEFGAGLQGKPSPLDARIRQQREDRLLQTTELKAHVDALEAGAKITKTLQGSAKASFVKDYASQLDQMRPGLGGTFSHIAEQPDILTTFQQYMPYLPGPMKLMLTQNPDAFWKVVGTPEGLKEIENAKNQAYMGIATKKATSTMSLLQQLPLPPELVKEAVANPSASTFKKVQDALPAGHPAKLDESQWAAINSTPINQEMFYNSLNLMSPKEEAAVRTKKAERKAEGPQSTVGKIQEDLAAGRITQEQADAAIKQATTHPAPVNVYSGSLTAGVDTQGNAVFVQPSGREGVAPRKVEGVTPPPKQVDPIKAAIAGAMNPGAEGKPAAKSTPKPAPAAKAESALPAEIVASLKAGVNTTLSDGSVWTLVSGKPKKVR